MEVAELSKRGGGVRLAPLAEAALGGLPLAVLGAGLSGRGALRLAEVLGVPARCYDEAGAARFSLRAAAEHRLVVVSPGFAVDHPWVDLARAAGAVLWSEFDWAVAHWVGKVVAVTGTNGKSSLSRLLTLAFQTAGRPVVEVGNSGVPLSALLAESPAQNTVETWAVAEVSSFQSEQSVVLRPDAVLWTTFAPDHLDRHGSLSAYFAAKRRLVEHLAKGGRAWAGPTVAAASRQLGCELPEVLQPVAKSDPPPGFAPGVPSIGWSLAVAFWSAEGLPMEALRSAAEAFQPLPHRLQRVATVAGVDYWNDSKATNFEAAIAALRSIAPPIFWIAGGRGKGEDPEALLEAIGGRVAGAFLIGETAAELAAACSRAKVAAVRCRDLEQAVRLASEAAQQSRPSSVVLSPAMASLDQFRNFSHRGEVFTQAVFQLPPSGAAGDGLGRVGY